MPFKLVATQGKRALREAVPDGVKVVLAARDYLFSQASIVSSVLLEDESYMIHPATSQFVNGNGDAWSNQSLKANYPSFVGAFNYVNHVQEPSKSVGFIADAALRRRILDPTKNIFVYYVDILIATHRDHEDLISKLLNGKVKYLSMGCDAMVSQCSRCGEIFRDDRELCDHLYGDKGKLYVDGNGNRRIIAELLGDSEPDSVEFTEASWLSMVPAFHGAVSRNSLKLPEDADVEVVIPKFALERDAIQKYLEL